MYDLCDDIRDEIPLLALSDLEPEQKRRVEAHLARCPACRRAYEESVQVLGLLPLGLKPVAPPATLKADLMRMIATEAPDGLLKPSHAVDHMASETEGLRPAPNAEPSLRATQRRRWTGAGRWGWAAAALLLAWNVWSLADQRRLRSELESLLATHDQTMSGIRTIARVLAEPGFEALGRARLEATPNAPGSRGVASVYKAGDLFCVVVYAYDLPGLRSGETYQVWLIENGVRHNGGTFRVDRAGRGMVVFVAEQPIPFDAVGITREPDDQGQQPRGVRVLAGTLQT